MSKAFEIFGAAGEPVLGRFGGIEYRMGMTRISLNSRSFGSVLRYCLLVGCAMALPSCRHAPVGEETVIQTADGRTLDYRNGWYHTANGTETVRAVAELYMRDPALVAQLNRQGINNRPAAGTTLYIPPVHDRDALEEVLKRINLHPESVPQQPPPLHLIWAASPESSDDPEKSSDAAPSAKEVQVASGGDNGKPKIKPDPAPKPGDKNGPAFDWPVDGRVIRKFTIERGSIFRGITIAAAEQQAIKASREGKVVYAGELKGYGNMIVLDHGDGFSSVYGYNNSLLVHADEEVRMGQEIAHAGRPSQGSPDQLFFQIRKNARPVNPLDYLH